ncbi:MAG: hypothetical protein JWM47_3683 [Acidimicrobiales bacterium]|nr:hypothetical protein [Acidimicrobiales bacterium]
MQRTRPATTVIAVALAAALALAGCGSGSDDAAVSTTVTEAAGASTTTTTTTTTTPTVTSTTESSEAGADTTTTTESSEGRDTETSELDTLPDGIHYGYMAGLEDGKVEGQDVQVIIFDKVEFLTGDAAAEAATEAGDESPPPNGYYIVNENQTVRRLAVVPDAQVMTLEGGSPDLVPSSVSDVALGGDDHLYKIDVGNTRGITTVSLIEAVYLP